MMRWLLSSREERLQGCCSECRRHSHTVLPHVRCTLIVIILPMLGSIHVSTGCVLHRCVMIVMHHASDSEAESMFINQKLPR